MKQTFAHPHDDEQRHHVVMERPNRRDPDPGLQKGDRLQNDEVTRLAPLPRNAGSAPRAAGCLSSVSTSKAYSAEVSTNTSFTGVDIDEIRVVAFRDIGGVIILGAE